MNRFAEHAIRANGVGYWLALTRNTVSYYVRMRRWAALARATWLTLVRGYYLEVCQLCGRKVGFVWHADDALYQAATGANGAGVFCAACFDRLADPVCGSYIVWVPLVAKRGDTWAEVLGGEWRP